MQVVRRQGHEERVAYPANAVLSALSTEDCHVRERNVCSAGVASSWFESLNLRPKRADEFCGEGYRCLQRSGIGGRDGTIGNGLLDVAICGGALREVEVLSSV